MTGQTDNEKVPPAPSPQMMGSAKPTKRQIEAAIDAYEKGSYLNDEQVLVSVIAIVSAAIAAETHLTWPSFDDWWRHHLQETDDVTVIECVKKAFEASRAALPAPDVTNHGCKSDLHPEYVTPEDGTKSGYKSDLHPGNVPSGGDE